MSLDQIAISVVFITTIMAICWLLEGKMSKVKKKEVKELDYEQIAVATAKDLVEISQVARRVLSNSTFNFDVIEDVKLLESMTRSVLSDFVKKEDKSE